jgi:hypothetical protein
MKAVLMFIPVAALYLLWLGRIPEPDIRAVL